MIDRNARRGEQGEVGATAFAGLVSPAPLRHRAAGLNDAAKLCGSLHPQRVRETFGRPKSGR